MFNDDLKKAYETSKAQPVWPVKFVDRMNKFIAILNASGFEAAWTENPTNGVDVNLARDGVSQQFHLMQSTLAGPLNLRELFLDMVGKLENREMLQYWDDQNHEHSFFLETEKEAKKMAEFFVKQLGRVASFQVRPALRQV